MELGAATLFWGCVNAALCAPSARAASEARRRNSAQPSWDSEIRRCAVAATGSDEEPARKRFTAAPSSHRSNFLCRVRPCVFRLPPPDAAPAAEGVVGAAAAAAVTEPVAEDPAYR